MAARTRRGGVAGATDEVSDRNEVVLTGRVSGEPTSRALPSGDEVVTLRVVVRRTVPGGADRRAGQDTVDCALWSPALRRRALSLTEGDLVTVEGSLRRRFWRAPTGAAASRYEVEVSRLLRRRRRPSVTAL